MFFNLKSCIMRYLFSSKSNEEKIKTDKLRNMFYGWRIGLNDFKIEYSRQDEIDFLKKVCYDINLVKKVFDEHYETEWGCYYSIKKDKIISVHTVDENEKWGCYYTIGEDKTRNVDKVDEKKIKVELVEKPPEKPVEKPVENEVKEVEKVVESVVEKVLEKIEEEEEVEVEEIEIEVEVSVKKEDDIKVDDMEVEDIEEEEEKEEKRRKYLTGYILFCKANRSDAIEELKATTGSDDPLPTDVIKKLASMWNELKKTQPAVAKGWNEKAKDIKEDDDE